MTDVIEKIAELRRQAVLTKQVSELKAENTELKKAIQSLIMARKEQESKKYRIEKKFNGFHVSVHKYDDEVKIYSEQKKDITIAFPTLVKEILKLSKEDFVVDGELVAYEGEKALGRNALMKYMGAVKKNKQIDDSNVKLHLWDILLYGNEYLVPLPLETRLKYLNKLNFTKRITNTPGFIVETENEAREAIKKCSQMPGSEGAVIKDMSAPYTFDEKSSAWLKYRHLVTIDVVVLERYKKENGYNYLVGIYVSKDEVKRLNPKKMSEINGKKVLVLGKTFNTTQIAEPGDIIEVDLEEVWRHVGDDGIYYSIHKPRVVGKVPSKKTSDIEDLEDIVTSIGVKVTEFNNRIMVEFAHDDTRKIIKDWPQWVQQPLKQIMKKRAWMPFVIQHHYRGHIARPEEGLPEKYLWNLKSVHSDLRCFLPRNYEKIKDGEVIKYEEAKKVDGLCFGITINTPPSVDKEDEFTNNAKNILCEFKLPIPKGWLYVEGIARIDDPGSTKNAPAVFVIVAKGEYTCHTVEDHKIVLEFRCRTGKKNMSVFEEADKKGIYIKNKFGDRLKDLKGEFAFTINHIGDKHIILLNAVSPKRETKMTREKLNQIFFYTEEGKTRKEIAEFLGVSPATVYRYQKILGLV